MLFSHLSISELTAWVSYFKMQVAIGYSKVKLINVNLSSAFISSSLGDRSFTVAGHCLWNNLPPHLHDSEHTRSPRVPPVTEDALVLLRAVARSDSLLFEHLIDLHLHYIMLHLWSTQIWRVCNKGSHILPTTDTWTDEPCPPLLPSRKASSLFGWYSLHLPTKGWPGWVDLGGWLGLLYCLILVSETLASISSEITLRSVIIS